MRLEENKKHPDIRSLFKNDTPKMNSANSPDINADNLPKNHRAYILHCADMILGQMNSHEGFKDDVRIGAMLLDVSNAVLDQGEPKPYSKEHIEHTIVLAREYGLSEKILGMISNHHSSHTNREVCEGAKILSVADVYATIVGDANSLNDFKELHEKAMRILQTDVKIGHKSEKIVNYLKTAVEELGAHNTHKNRLATRRILLSSQLESKDSAARSVSQTDIDKFVQKQKTNTNKNRAAFGH